MRRRNCDIRPNYWKDKVFDKLHTQKYFPNALLGFGEVGYSSSAHDDTDKELFCYKSEIQKKTICGLSKKELMEKYYNIHINENYFVGGYFWWTAQTDMKKAPKFQIALNNKFKNF